MRATTLGPGTVGTGGVPSQIATGRCSAWSPPDETSPQVARSLLRRVRSTGRLPGELVADAALCVRERPINAITHVPGGHLPAPPVAPKLWVYRRGQEGRPQLVVAVFDALRRGRDRDTAGREDLFAEGGRGLDTVGTLAAGRPVHQHAGRRSVPSVERGPTVWRRAGAFCGRARWGANGVRSRTSPRPASASSKRTKS